MQVIQKFSTKLKKRSNSLTKRNQLRLYSSQPPVQVKSSGSLRVPDEYVAAVKQENELIESLDQSIKEARRNFQKSKDNAVLEQIAKATGKNVKDVTRLEVAKYLLDKREDFVKNIDLEKVVLFSSQARLDEFKKLKASIDVSKLPKGSPLPEILANEEAALTKLAANEEVIELEVDSDVYSFVKEKLFPSLRAKGVTEEEFADYLELNAPATAEKFAVFQKHYNAALSNYKLPLGPTYQLERGATQELALSPEGKQLGAELTAVKNKHESAADAISKKLNRKVKLGDIYPEKRLIAGETDQHHPLLDENRKIYVPGTLKLANQGNLGEISKSEADDDAFKQLIEQRSEEFLFEVNKEFQPPTHFRQPTEDDLKKMPYLKNKFIQSLLDFTIWEGDDVQQPYNAGERMLGLKLWKFWSYIYPQYATSAQRQRFAEEFEISPGERTLEWTLAYPPEDHTFTEIPIIKETEGEEDEHHAVPAVPHKSAIQWPRYRPQLQSVIWDADVEVKEDHGHEILKVKTKAPQELNQPDYKAALLTSIKDRSKNPDVLSKVDKYLAELKSKKVSSK